MKKGEDNEKEDYDWLAGDDIDRSHYGMWK